MSIDSLDGITETLRGEDYVSDDAVSMSLFLALKMGRPLFLEGAPGVGKTEIARVLGHAFETELIRLQCYEGLDIHHALYEWNYPRQLLRLQAGQKEDLGAIYSDEYLLKRPLLQAIDPKRTSAAVLLIDEIDRADEEFESFLLELLSDFQVTIPELGRVEGDPSADRDPHLEPDARDPRRPQTPMHLLLDRLPEHSRRSWRSSR